MRWVERFCYKHPNFGIKNLMLYITIGNVALWVLEAIDPGICSLFMLSPALVMRGQVWRLVTFIFVPNSLSLIAFVVYAFYYWMGSALEEYWGTGQFTVFFLTGIVFTVVYGFICYFFGFYGYINAPHYMYLSMLFAFATLYPDMTINFMWIIPMPIKYLAYIDAAFFAYGILREPMPEKLIPVVAVMNFFIFCGAELFGSMKRYKRSKNAVNFQKASRRIKQEQRQKLYNHKCAVCGKTDTDYPSLQFRYCSRCAGYHCFCEEHIYNHVHFTE